LNIIDTFLIIQGLSIIFRTVADTMAEKWGRGSNNIFMYNTTITVIGTSVIRLTAQPPLSPARKVSPFHWHWL
jgi:hypothetical protein